jgi:cell division topological specificity factor
MKIFNYFLRRNGSAPVARERLQILLAHERSARNEPDLLGVIREEILAVIAKHVNLDPDKVQVKLERGKTVATLEVDIEVPNRFGMPLAAAS